MHELQLVGNFLSLAIRKIDIWKWNFSLKIAKLMVLQRLRIPLWFIK